MLRALDDGDALAKIGSLSASLFSGGTAANYDEIKIFARSHHNLPSAQNASSRGRSFSAARRVIVLDNLQPRGATEAGGSVAKAGRLPNAIAKPADLLL
jgi:hypothetical protein